MLIKSKNRVAFLLLILMFLFKFIAVQTYAHASHHKSSAAYAQLHGCEQETDTEDEHCETCKDIFDAALTPFSSEPISTDTSLALLLAKEECQKPPYLLAIKEFFVSDLSNRPPPSFF